MLYEFLYEASERHAQTHNSTWYEAFGAQGEFCLWPRDAKLDTWAHRDSYNTVSPALYFEAPKLKATKDPYILQLEEDFAALHSAGY